RRGNRIARLYLMAWVLMTVSGFALALMYQGLLPYFPVSTHLVFAAYVVSILLFSLVLAEQLHLANLEKAQLLLNHNQQLEARVLQRTSELQHSLETVDALNRSKTRLFTILAHDLRSPFASLKLMLVMLDRDTLDMSHLHMLIPRLRRQIDGIYASLENMLEWARIEMGGIKGEPELLDLSGLLHEIEAMYAAAAHQKQITFELVPSAALEIRANRHQLHLVLRNLVNNAVKFTPAKGRVSLSAWEQDGGLRVRVQDTGIGMSPVQVADLFGTQPGQAVRHTELIRNGTEGERGIGLGLQLCKTYLEGMNARLVIDSEPGRGSVFELHFAKSEQPETHSLSLDPVTAAEAE
ncbi:MAG: sensor histidine kinase, partial [Candidatus Sericytochromatia bacterium]